MFEQFVWIDVLDYSNPKNFIATQKISREIWKYSKEVFENLPDIYRVEAVDERCSLK